jgi:hypothetical protein
MNPRFRRLLIPGLLVALLVVVLVASIARKADGATPGPSARATEVSRISDPRITESSGLAISRTHPDLGYTINDSGHGPVVFAIRISTGAVVGTTRATGVLWRDTEAMALGPDDTLWVADMGDNLGVRQDVALYSMPAPGTGDHTVTPKRYPVTLPTGPEDVEGIAVHPRTGRILVMGKAMVNGRVYRLPKTLHENHANRATATDWTTPVLTTDAAYTPDGRYLLVRNYLVAQVRDARTWKLLHTDELPEQPQGETIAPEPSGRSYLVGSEGRDSALLRLGLSTHDDPVPAPSATPTVAAPPEDKTDDPGPPAWVLAAGGLGGVIVLAGVAAWITRRR